MSVAVRVIPCLDVDGGRVVKGVNFRELRDAGDPVELAARYDAEGADELTFLDITASSGGRAPMYDAGRRSGGQGLTPPRARRALRAGPARQFGSQCVVLWGAARRVRDGPPPTPSGFEVTTHG